VTAVKLITGLLRVKVPARDCNAGIAKQLTVSPLQTLHATPCLIV
jgi:hypothetical protein